MNFKKFQEWLATNHPTATVTLVDNTHPEYENIADNGGTLTPKSVAVAVVSMKNDKGQDVPFQLPQAFLTDLQQVKPDTQASVSQIRGRVAILENGESVIHMRQDPDDADKVEHLAGKKLEIGDIVTYSIKGEGDVVAFLEQDKNGQLRPHASKLYVRTRSANAVTGIATAEQLYAAQLGSKGQVAAIAAKHNAALQKDLAIGSAFGAIANLLQSGKVSDATQITQFAGMLGITAEKNEEKAVA